MRSTSATSEPSRVSRALVTGCAGFIGSQLTESLLANGVSVIGVDCFNANYGRPQKLQNLDASLQWDSFDFVPIDLSRGDLNDLVEEVDTVFHLAAEPGVRSSWGSRFGRYVANNITATQHVLDALVAVPGRRLVYASSSSVYGQAVQFPTDEDATPAPRSPYGMTKLAGEHLCSLYAANHGVETVSLRYFTVFGPRQRPDMAFNIFCRKAILSEEISVFGDGEQTRDFTFVDDIVAATRSAAEIPVVKPDAVYNLGGGFQSSLNEVLAMIEEISGRELRIRYLDNELGDVRDTSADTTRAQRDLGFAPGTTLRDGIAAEFEWMSSVEPVAS